jgi:hypothetical protein
MLHNCYNLYYPGSGIDFEVLNYFIKNSSIKNFFYCDYIVTTVDIYELQDDFEGLINQITSLLNDDYDRFNNNESPYEVTFEKDLDYTDFNQEDWSAFWHPMRDRQFGDPEGSRIHQFKITKKDLTKEPKFNRKTGEYEDVVEEWKLIYFGTEAINTFNVLLESNIYFDVVVTQNHGLGGFFTTFCRGSLLEKYAIEKRMLPKFIMLDEGGGGGWYTGPWDHFSPFYDSENNRFEVNNKTLYYNHTISFLNDYLLFDERQLRKTKIRFITDKSTNQSLDDLMEKKTVDPQINQGFLILERYYELLRLVYDDRLKEKMEVDDVVIGLIHINSKYWLLVALDEIIPARFRDTNKEKSPIQEFQKYIGRMVIKLPFIVNNDRIYNSKRIMNYMEVMGIYDATIDYKTLKTIYV